MIGDLVDADNHIWVLMVFLNFCTLAKVVRRPLIVVNWLRMSSWSALKYSLDYEMLSRNVEVLCTV